MFEPGRSHAFGSVQAARECRTEAFGVMKRAVSTSATVFALVALGTGIAQSQNAAGIQPASPALVAALSAVRAAPIPSLVTWIGSQQAPSAGSDPLSVAESQIAALTPGDRDAIVFWLSGHGRGALQAQGATDAQIGIPYYPLDYDVAPAPFPQTVGFLPPAPPIPTPTPAPPQHHRSFLGFLAAAAQLPGVNVPVAQSSSSSVTNNADGSQTIDSSSSSVSVGFNPAAVLGSILDAADAHGSAQSPSSAWRQVPFGAATLDAASSPSGIAITHGISSVRYDGTEGFACISFQNNAQQAVTEVDVDIQVVDGLGLWRRVVPLRRSGSFGPGALVNGPGSLRDVNASRPNCVIDGAGDLDDPSNPFSGAAAVGYAIRQVTYADGSVWREPGANPWPATLSSLPR